jgi:hypothetical protein
VRNRAQPASAARRRQLPCGDRELALEIPGADKYLDRSLLLIVEGRRVA